MLQKTPTPTEPNPLNCHKAPPDKSSWIRSNQVIAFFPLRWRMDRFISACAVDQTTIQCRGPLDDCRIALINILGTPLRTNCACSGNDFSLLYSCIDWQRLIWLNPCVVQAQKEYHEMKMITPPPLTTKPTPKTPVISVNLDHSHSSTGTKSTATTNGPHPTPMHWIPTIKPTPPDTGVYLFLGYSKVEEASVKNFTNMTISNSVHDLQKLLESQEKACRMMITQQIEDNVIIQVYLIDFNAERQNNSITPEMVMREEEICAGPLQNLTRMINRRDPAVHNHVAMSILKQATVDVHAHKFQGASAVAEPLSGSLFVFMILVQLLLRRPP
uniref:GDNF/GAS1 domain-containing protein n=1 Tax=Strigamia maritima TaxID=126957 RepID=T1IPB9_STRMM